MNINLFIKFPDCLMNFFLRFDEMDSLFKFIQEFKF
jgi:hypothetical protein